MHEFEAAKSPRLFIGFNFWKKRQKGNSPVSGWQNDEAGNGDIVNRQSSESFVNGQHVHILNKSSSNLKVSPQHEIEGVLASNAPRVSRGSIRNLNSDPLQMPASDSERKERTLDYGRKVVAYERLKLKIRHPSSENSLLGKGKTTMNVLDTCESSSTASSRSLFESDGSVTDKASMQEDTSKTFSSNSSFSREIKTIDENAHLYFSEDGDGAMKDSDRYESSITAPSSLYESSGSITDLASTEEDSLEPFYDKLTLGQDSNVSEELPAEIVVPEGHEEFAGLLKELIEKMRSKRTEKQGDAVAQLRMLTQNSVQYREVLSHQNLLEALVPLLESESSTVQIDSIGSLSNLSLEKDNKIKMIRAGAASPLIKLLKRGHPEVQEHATAAILSLALNDDNHFALGALGVIAPLTNILRSESSTSRGRRDSAMALYHLCHAHINRPKMVKAGLVPVLLSIAKDHKDELSVRSMRILSLLASTQEACSALLDLMAIPALLFIVEQSEMKDQSESDKLKEHAMATLLCLSHKTLRFRALALQSQALDVLAPHTDKGTPRSREKCLALLKILREGATHQLQTSTLVDSEQCPRSYGPKDSTGIGGYSPRILDVKGNTQKYKAQTSDF